MNGIKMDHNWKSIQASPYSLHCILQRMFEMCQFIIPMRSCQTSMAGNDMGILQNKCKGEHLGAQLHVTSFGI